MRIAVTGGAGFVGSTIVRRLIGEGHHVLVVDDLSTGKSANIEDVRCDFHHVDAGTTNYTNFDAIVHAAAYPDVSQNWRHPQERRQQWERNAELTRRILERDMARGVRFVLLSTCSVYAGGKVDELTPPRATSPYAASKLAAEALVSAHHEAGRIQGSILRLVNVVGTRYAHGHVADFVRSALGGRVHALDDGAKAKTFVHVEDVADVVAGEVAMPIVLPRNVTGEREWSWRDTIALMRTERPDLPFDLTWEDRPSGWIGDPEQLVVRSRHLNPGKRPIANGVREALASLGWLR